MKHRRATRFLVNNAYKKLKQVVDDPSIPQRVLLAVVKQALFDAFIFAPPADQLGARRFLLGDGFAKACLDLGIDYEYGSGVIMTLSAQLRSSDKMAKLDAGLKKLTAGKRDCVRDELSEC